MIDISNGMLSFVFGNEDRYPLKNLAELNLYQYISYELRIQGIKYLYFIRTGRDGYYLTIVDEASEELLNKAPVSQGFFGQRYGRPYSRLKREKIDWDCPDLDELIDKKLPYLMTQESNVAFVFALPTFCNVIQDDINETINSLISIEGSARENRNAIVLVGGVSDAAVHEDLAGPESVFRYRDPKGRPLCRELTEILEDPGNPPLYHEMKRKLGGRCVWLNEFSPGNVENLLRRMELEDSPSTFGDDRTIRETAQYISRWYAVPRQDTAGGLLRENRRRRFADLKTDLRRAGVMLGLRKLIGGIHSENSRTKAEAPVQQPGAGYVGVEAEDSIAEALGQIRIPESMSKADGGAGLQEQVSMLYGQYKAPRVKPIDRDLRQDLEKLVFTLQIAIANGDLQTVQYILDTLEYALKIKLMLTEDTSKIWKCKLAIVKLSGNLYDLDRQKAEDRILITENREKKRRLMEEIRRISQENPGVGPFLQNMEAGMAVDLYSPDGQKAQEVCRLADRVNRIQEQLKACMAAYTFHLKQYDDEKDTLDQLQFASRGVNNIRSVDVTELLNEIYGDAARKAEQEVPSEAQEKYDIQGMINNLTVSAMNGGEVNYINALRQYRQMEKEETNGA